MVEKKPTQYRVFASSVTSTTGCDYRFLVGDEVNPAERVMECARCGKTHPFWLERIYMANTPKQRAVMKDWCQRRGVEIKTDLE